MLLGVMLCVMHAVLQDRETVVLPRKADRHSRKTNSTLKIIKTLEFSSLTLRSGVVVSASDGPPNSARLFLRGAPAVIRELVQPSSLPSDFSQVRLAGPGCCPSNCVVVSRYLGLKQLQGIVMLTAVLQ